jgi:hypothetical protein
MPPLRASSFQKRKVTPHVLALWKGKDQKVSYCGIQEQVYLIVVLGEIHIQARF